MGALRELLSQDHARLDELLTRALAQSEGLGREAYEAFRAGLLRHIAIEEKVLLREAKRRRAGVALPMAAQLRADHAALAALLVPTPSASLLETLRQILVAHNPLEEGEDGLYAICERLFADELEAIVGRIAAAPDVPLSPHFNGERAHMQIARLLQARTQVDG